MTLSESELFTGDTSNDNHFPGPVISEVIEMYTSRKMPMGRRHWFPKFCTYVNGATAILRIQQVVVEFSV